MAVLIGTLMVCLIARTQSNKTDDAVLNIAYVTVEVPVQTYTAYVALVNIMGPLAYIGTTKSIVKNGWNTN